MLKRTPLKRYTPLNAEKGITGYCQNKRTSLSLPCGKGIKNKSGISTLKTENKPKFPHLAKSPINKISKKKQKEMRNETKIRKQLREECGGVSQISGNSPDWRGLSMHETRFRSHGGKVSKENSHMITGREHNLKHGIVEVDSKTKFRWIP